MQSRSNYISHSRRLLLRGKDKICRLSENGRIRRSIELHQDKNACLQTTGTIVRIGSNSYITLKEKMAQFARTLTGAERSNGLHGSKGSALRSSVVSRLGEMLSFSISMEASSSPMENRLFSNSTESETEKDSGSVLAIPNRKIHRFTFLGIAEADDM